MDLKFGDVQETALITLAIRASETSRPDARISILMLCASISDVGLTTNFRR